MNAVLTCMVDEKIGPGEMNKRLIALVLEKFDAAAAQSFRSPARALVYALDALDVPKDSSVMISALAPAWHYIEILRRGNTPLVLDVDVHTGLVTPAAVAQGMQDGGRVLVLHHTLGLTSDMDGFLACGVPIIEDISRCAGAAQNGKKYGCFGTFAILGLEEKDMLTAGGGAVLFAHERRNAAVLNRRKPVPDTDLLPDINAALAFVQVKQMSKNAEIRAEMYRLYTQALSSGRHKTPPVPEDGAVYSFPVVFERGSGDARKYAARKGVLTEPAFSGAVIDYLGEDEARFPHARSLFLRSVLFPLYPRLGSVNAHKVAKIIASLP